MYGLDAYQEEAKLTAKYPGAGSGEMLGIIYTVMGLVGEAGELANFLKKRIRKGVDVSEEDAAEMMEELGDVLWYVANLAEELGYDLSHVAAFNVDKLQKRDAAGRITKLD